MRAGLCLAGCLTVAGCAATGVTSAGSPRDEVRALLMAELGSQVGTNPGLEAAANCTLDQFSNTQVALFLDADSDAGRQSVVNAIADPVAADICAAQALGL